MNKIKYFLFWTIIALTISFLIFHFGIKEWTTNTNDSFFATLITVILGFPISLLVYNIGESINESKKKKEETEVLIKSYHLARVRVEHNLEVLNSLIFTVETKHIKDLTELDYLFWDTIKPYVMQDTSNQYMHQKLAWYCFRIENIDKYDDRYFMIKHNIWNMGNPENEKEYVSYYIDTLKATVKGSEELLLLLDKEILKLKKKK